MKVFSIFPINLLKKAEYIICGETFEEDCLYIDSSDINTARFVKSKSMSSSPVSFVSPKT